jgi:hypothetical protein
MRTATASLASPRSASARSMSWREWSRARDVRARACRRWRQRTVRAARSGPACSCMSPPLARWAGGSWPPHPRKVRADPGGRAQRLKGSPAGPAVGRRAAVSLEEASASATLNRLPGKVPFRTDSGVRARRARQHGLQARAGVGRQPRSVRRSCSVPSDVRTQRRRERGRHAIGHQAAGRQRAPCERVRSGPSPSRRRSPRTALCAQPSSAASWSSRRRSSR